MAIQLSGSLAITGSLVATGQIVAQTLNVQQVTSSIVYSSGSNIFGNSVSNTQQFTGSLQVSGSNHYVLGNVGIGTSTPITNLHIVNNTNVGLRLQATAANGSSELDLLSHGTQNAFLDYGPNALRFRSTNSDMSAIVSGSVLVLENGGSIGVGTTSPDIFSRGDALNVGISAAGASDNMALSLNAGGSGGRGAQIYMGQGGTRHFTLSSNTTETTLGTSTNTPLRLNTNDTTRMFISSSGNVGIGTTSPGKILNVAVNDSTSGNYQARNAVVRIQNTNDSAANSRFAGVQFSFSPGASTGDNYVIGAIGAVLTDSSTQWSGDLVFAAKSATTVTTLTEYMRIATGGNVGIGNTSPSYKLDVSGTGRFSTELRITDVPASAYAIKTVSSDWANGSTIFTGIKIGAAADTFAAGIDLRAISNYASTAGTQFAIAVNSTGNTMTEVLRINASGNVGIGTTSPSFRLDVNGQGRFITSSNSVVDILSLDNTSVVSAGVRQLFNNGYGNLAAIRVSQRDNGSLADDGQLEFQVASNASLDTKMTILNNGNVGIGTTSPSFRLDVNGDIYANGDIRSQGIFRDYQGEALLQTNTSAVTQLGSAAASTSRTLAFLAGNAERLRITSDGNLLVGTTSLRTTGYTTGNSQYAMENTGYGGAQWFTNRNDEEGSYIVLGKSRGTTVNSNTVVASGDILGAIIFQGTDGTNSDPAAMIRSRVDGTPGSNDMPGRLEFLTTADGSATLTERMRITSGGNAQYTGDPFIYSNTTSGGTAIHSGLRFHSTDKYIRFFTNDLGRMDITSGGNVGIGTTSPRTKTEFSSGLPTSIPTRTNTTSGIAVTDGGAIYGRIGVADLSAGGVGYPTYIQAGDWDGASYYNILLNPLGGNVGIGTTSPAYKFQSNGPNGDWSGYFKGSSSSGNSYGLFIDAGTTSADSPFMVRSADGATTFLRILGNGNVGINTTSPGAKLDATYAANNYVRLIGGGGTTAGNIFLSKISDYSDGSPINLFWADHGSPARTNTLIRIHTNETAEGGYPLRVTAQGTLASPTYEAITVNHLGNVGIGTTSPLAKQHNVITSNGTALLLNNSTGGGGAFVDLDFTTYTTTQPGYANACATIRIIDDGNFSGHIVFRTKGGSIGASQTEQFRIQSNGNVGIGTSSPSTKLHVAGIITAATTSNSGRINFGLEDTGIAIYRDNAYDLVIQQDASSGSPVYISGAGNVVISIDSNNNQTDCAFIVGSNAIKSVNTLFSVNESGNATVAGTLTELSSIRYKENIENIRYGLDKVVQLRGVTYTKKDTGVKEIGLIAEEVESILPDLILRNPEGEADSISYSRITAVLIEAIKELKIEIEELKANR